MVLLNLLLAVRGGCYHGEALLAVLQDDPICCVVSLEDGANVPLD